MKLGTILLFAAPIVLILMTVGAPAAKAWDCGGGGCGWGNCYHHWGDGVGYHHYWSGSGCGSCDGGGDYYNTGYQAGVQDAIYDHQNNLVYSDQPSCLSCHSQSYLEGFRSGYDQQYNSYQNQESTQSANINVENSPGAQVNVGQSSEQQQNPLQQLAHLACGFVNCNQPPLQHAGWNQEP